MDDVTITRASEDGTQWTITGSFPVDRTIATGGHDRIVSRVAGEMALDSNNLD